MTTDQYLKFVNSKPGRFLAKQLGLPQPVPLERYREGSAAINGSVLLGASENASLGSTMGPLLRDSARQVFTPDRWTGAEPLKAAVFDASGISCAEQLVQFHGFFQPVIKHLGQSARVVVVGLLPETCPPRQQVAQRALLGAVKSLAKELRGGGTANLIWAAPHTAASLHAPLAFFASDRSAYVSGQFLRVSASEATLTSFTQPLVGKRVLVTGAARGIGKAIAQLASRRGARVTVLDVPAAASAAAEVAKDLQGDYLTLDITAADAADRIAQHFADQPMDAVVHNAGITRDKKLVNMKAEMWQLVIETNLACQERINHRLIELGLLSAGSRIVLVSSISGIAGNAGQTNYAASKAGVIGMVEAYAPRYRDLGLTINAVAPGFIETEMVATIPFAMRQAGRRLNSLAQAGRPEDVAEAVTLFLQADSQGLSGNVLRVCGQALLGA